jgi:hypothetical protein
MQKRNRNPKQRRPAPARITTATNHGLSRRPASGPLCLLQHRASYRGVAARVLAFSIMIRAYLDETGQHERDYVFIAGHIGYESQWNSFIPAWQNALGAQRKRLHMRRLHWTSSSTQRLLARLGPIPAACGLNRLIGGVRVADYEDLIPGPRSKKTLNGYACALMSIGVTLLLGSIPEGEQYELILERQDVYAVHARFVFSTLAQDPNPTFRTKDGKLKLANWSFAPSKSTMLFDQADYLCYALAQKHKAPNSRKALWTAPILESGGDTIGRIMTRDEIREAVLNEPYPGSNKV